MNIPKVMNFLWVMLAILILTLFEGCTYQEPTGHGTVYRGPYPVKYYYYKEKKNRLLAKEKVNPGLFMPVNSRSFFPGILPI